MRERLVLFGWGTRGGQPNKILATAGSSWASGDTVAALRARYLPRIVRTVVLGACGGVLLHFVLQLQLHKR